MLFAGGQLYLMLTRIGNTPVMSTTEMNSITVYRIYFINLLSYKIYYSIE